MRRFLEIGGIAAGAVLIAFGIGSLVLSAQGKSTVKDSLKLEKIVGSPDMTPEAIAAEAKEAGLTDVDLPDSTVVKDGTYTATQDYQLTAFLLVPAGDSAAAMKTLQASFGKCGSAPAPMDTTGLKSVCVMANDDNVTASDQASSRLWVVGTGTTTDGNLVIGMSIKSR